MGRNRIVMLACAWALATAATAATASEVTVTVDAASGPWNRAANAKKMPYGSGDEKPPVIVPFDVGGGKLGIYAEGTTDTPDAKGIGPSGIEDKAVDDTLGPKKARYPSFYVPKLLYPSNRHGLVAIFVNAEGVAVSRALMVGTGILVPIPEGATGVALGFNDVTFAGNTGTLKVTVQIPD